MICFNENEKKGHLQPAGHKGRTWWWWGSVIIYTALVFQCSRVKKGAVTVINRKVVFSI